MGRTTAGASTSVNSRRWTAIYQKYITFYEGGTRKSFKFNEIAGKITPEIREINTQLSKDLESLDEYYGDIGNYFMQIGHMRNENLLFDSQARATLGEFENKLCRDDRLHEYLYAAIGALRKLAIAATTIKAHVSPTSTSPPISSSTSSTSSSELSDEEDALLTDLLNEIASISTAVKQDYVAEVGNESPAGSLRPDGQNRQVWDTYAADRRKSLRLAGRIDESWFRN